MSRGISQYPDFALKNNKNPPTSCKSFTKFVKKLKRVTNYIFKISCLKKVNDKIPKKTLTHWCLQKTENCVSTQKR